MRSSGFDLSPATRTLSQTDRTLSQVEQTVTRALLQRTTNPPDARHDHCCRRLSRRRKRSTTQIVVCLSGVATASTEKLRLRRGAFQIVGAWTQGYGSTSCPEQRASVKAGAGLAGHLDNANRPRNVPTAEWGERRCWIYVWAVVP